MAIIEKVLGRRRDLPMWESINLNSSSAGGVGTDYEHTICFVPQLAQGIASGLSGDLPSNAQNVRNVTLIFEAALTGVATNNFTINILQRRAGALLVNTTSATTIIAGQNTVTPASMNNIVVGSLLVFSGGTGATETVTVSAVTPTTFTATFANGHSGAYTIVAAPLATITYASGVNETAFVPHQFNVPVSAANVLKPGDCVTIQRVSNGTGLASPALTVGVDLVPAGIGL
jgi:hypothetical protein